MECIHDRLCFTYRLLAFLAAMSASTVVSAQVVVSYAVTIIPPNPRILEPVVARLVTSATCLVGLPGVRLSQDGTAVGIHVTLAPGFCTETSAPVSQDVSLGHFLPGAFQVNVFLPDSTVIGTAAFTVTDTYAGKIPGRFPLVDYTDHWWNPLESGWGISIHQHPSDRLFAIWFVYNQSGLPVWYTLQPGAWTSATAYTGPVYKTTGPYFGGPFNPTQVVASLVGTATLNFTDSDTATFSYTIEGVSGSKPITRLPF